jgi:hypothetical protein
VAFTWLEAPFVRATESPQVDDSPVVASFAQQRCGRRAVDCGAQIRNPGRVHIGKDGVGALAGKVGQGSR